MCRFIQVDRQMDSKHISMNKTVPVLASPTSLQLGCILINLPADPWWRPQPPTSQLPMLLPLFFCRGNSSRAKILKKKPNTHCSIQKPSEELPEDRSVSGGEGSRYPSVERVQVVASGRRGNMVRAYEMHTHI